jgi:beta-galactosidase
MFGQSLRRWKEQGIDSKDPESLVRHRHKQKRLADGAVLHQHSVVVPKELADLPRIGVRFTLPESFDTIRWFGEGPHECYPDRRSSALTGIWESSPDELPYLVPQEFGLRMACRWMEFSSASGEHDGHAIRITSTGNPLQMSALQYTPEDLFAAEEVGVLVKNNQLTVHLDVAHRGLGTASCGPDTLAQYRIAPGRYEFGYTVGWIRN